MITIIQGDSGYLLSIKVADTNGTEIPLAQMEKVLFTFRELEKSWASTPTEEDTVIYDSSINRFKIPFTQDETFALSGKIYMQVRVKFVGESEIIEIRGSERTAIEFGFANKVTL